MSHVHSGAKTRGGGTHEAGGLLRNTRICFRQAKKLKQNPSEQSPLMSQPSAIHGARNVPSEDSRGKFPHPPYVVLNILVHSGRASRWLVSPCDLASQVMVFHWYPIPLDHALAAIECRTVAERHDTRVDLPRPIPRTRTFSELDTHNPDTRERRGQGLSIQGRRKPSA